MDSASTSSELHSDTGSFADSDIREVDLELAAATAPTQVVEVSIHQSLVEEPPAIVEGQASTMDIVTSMRLCAQLITCAHAPHLGIKSNQMLLSSTSTPAPFLVAGTSFPPVMQGSISMLLGAPISLKGCQECRKCCTVPYRAPLRCQRHIQCWSAMQRRAVAAAHSLCQSLCGPSTLAYVHA